MLTILDLWLAILLSAVAVFILSSVIHMLLPYHKSNFARIAREDDFRNAVRPLNIAPGEYMFPLASSMKDMESEEYLQKLSQGPVGMITVLPNAPFAMGKSLAQWFVYCLLIGVFAAYIATRALPADTEFMKVMQMVSATAFGGYALGLVQNSIWYHRKWSTTLKFMFDGLIYATTTGALFAWLWS